MKIVFEFDSDGHAVSTQFEVFSPKPPEEMSDIEKALIMEYHTAFEAVTHCVTGHDAASGINMLFSIIGNSVAATERELPEIDVNDINGLIDGFVPIVVGDNKFAEDMMRELNLPEVPGKTSFAFFVKLCLTVPLLKKYCSHKTQLRVYTILLNYLMKKAVVSVNEANDMLGRNPPTSAHEDAPGSDLPANIQDQINGLNLDDMFNKGE